MLAILLHLVVVFVEEPALRRRFGDLHDVYCEHVPRWIPRAGRPNAP
jgi:protein-S-isoprenylcysteine O-methyltransferase Ste14